jgi:hypothetical protein
MPVLRIWNFFYPESDFFHPGSKFFQIKENKIKELKYFNPKNCFLSSRNMIRVVHPRSGSRILILIFYSSRIQGSKKAPDPGSATLKDAMSWPKLKGSRKSLWCPKKGGNITRKILNSGTKNVEEGILEQAHAHKLLLCAQLST